MEKRFGLVQFETPKGEKYQGFINGTKNFIYLNEYGLSICDKVDYLKEKGWKMTHDLRSEYWIGQEGYFTDMGNISENIDGVSVDKIHGYNINGYQSFGTYWKYFTPIDHKKVAIKCEIKQLKQQIRDLEAKL